jgi:hypothetical protein
MSTLLPLERSSHIVEIFVSRRRNKTESQFRKKTFSEDPHILRLGDKVSLSFGTMGKKSSCRYTVESLVCCLTSSNTSAGHAVMCSPILISRIHVLFRSNETSCSRRTRCIVGNLVPVALPPGTRIFHINSEV